MHREWCGNEEVMREALRVNSRIDLFRQNGEQRQFVIKETVGEGGSCIVYEAHMLDVQDEFGLGKRVRLKECYPIRYASEK